MGAIHMPDQTIKCPKCGADLTEALTSQIEQSIKLKYEADAAAKDKEVQEKIEEINKQAKELEEKNQAIEEKVTQQVKAKQKEIAEQERKKILAEQEEQTKALEEELEIKRKQLYMANKKELELRKQQKKLDEEKETLELTVQRQLDEERKKITEQASKKAAEEHMLKDREKDNQLAAMKKQIDELKRKADVGSQEAQGEALEGELQEYLERSFPFDKFEEIKKGARGADVIHIVHNTAGKECGKILWESKNTKDFQKSWIEKIKKDQQEANAGIAVIMSVALPAGIDSFDIYDGVWITDYKSLKGLATALRQGLIEVARQKLVTTGQDSIKDLLYQYITGQEFIMRIRAIVEAFQRMNDELAKERRSMARLWSRREKQITTVIENVAGIHGSIEGLVGSHKALPEIELLSLESIAEEEENEDKGK
ncbi:MAG: DUF2130 domain-containing protein [Candidatus Omnitrophota bacterium]|nr:MAG: DUF2130 domain-containing protein [Candidatus Omnitrophota bacterium]